MSWVWQLLAAWLAINVLAVWLGARLAKWRGR